MSIVTTTSMRYDRPSSPPRPFLILATGSRGVFELFPRFPFHERRCGLALGKAVADNMRSAGLLRWKLQGSGDWKCRRSAARCPRGDFMRNLVPGITLVLSCAACGGSPTVLTAFRTEEQAQTHSPKMSSSGSTRRAASIISRGTGHMVARMQAATLVVPKPTPRACTECQTNHNQVADGFGNNRISGARSMLSA